MRYLPSILAALAAATTYADPLELSTHSTIYTSDQSAASSMFDIKAKTDIVVYGLDVNLATQSEQEVLVYTKSGSFQRFENDESAWKLVLNSTVVGQGADVPTSLLMEGWDPVVVPANTKQAFMVMLNDAYVRYSDFAQGDRLYYINHDLIIYGKGCAKRKGWDGGLISPRVFNGGVRYVTGNETVEVLSGNIVGLPTVSPTVSAIPTISPSNSPVASPSNEPSSLPSLSSSPSSSPSSVPSLSPTTSAAPTKSPTRRPTQFPTLSPQINTEAFVSTFVSEVTYAGVMYDIVAKQDIEIKGLGFNTYWTEELNVQVWTKRGSYVGHHSEESAWTKVIETAVIGAGLDKATMIPSDSFDRIKIKRGQRQSFYISTPDGPYLRASKATWEGKEVASNDQLIYYAGLGKRKGFDGFATDNRIANSVIVYEKLDLEEEEAPTVQDGMENTSYEFLPTDTTYIQNGTDVDNSEKTQMLVDGKPKRVTLLRFDLSALTLSPVVIKKAKLKLYAMTASQFGGNFSVFPDGEFHEDHVTWSNSPYSTVVGVNAGSIEGPIEEQTFLLKDLTKQFYNGIPKTLVIRIESDNANGVMYRSPAGNADNGPKLQVVLASDPAKASWIELFGTYAPTPAPTIDPEWENPKTLSDPPRDYFNYNPRSRYGPGKWDDIREDGWYQQYWRLDADLDRNRCSSGGRQSPQDLCETRDSCEEFHEPRTRAGQYGIDSESTIAKPTPYIMHNKLRLAYKQRRSEWERPEPPGTDFAKNVFNSGVQDVIHIDIKVKSEHTLCGKQYDGEMQIFHLHQVERNLEAMGILIEVDNSEGRNPHFQKLIDFFQKKFDNDKRMCKNRQLLAKRVFDESIKEDTNRDEIRSKLRGLKTEENHEPAMAKPSNQVEDENTEEVNTTLSIANRFLNLLQRRTAQDFVWNPYEPWYILRTIHFWAYSGSITEPPCFEGVNWRIMDVPIKITYGQLIQLQKLMFDHVDPDTCRKTSTHYEESNARPTQPYRGGRNYRCRRSDYVSDRERMASGLRKGFNQEKFWCGVKLLPWVEGEFPNV